MSEMKEKTAAITQGGRQRFQRISCTCTLRNKLHPSDDVTKMALKEKCYLHDRTELGNNILNFNSKCL